MGYASWILPSNNGESSGEANGNEMESGVKWGLIGPLSLQLLTVLGVVLTNYLEGTYE